MSIPRIALSSSGCKPDVILLDHTLKMNIALATQRNFFVLEIVLNRNKLIENLALSLLESHVLFSQYT